MSVAKLVPVLRETHAEAALARPADFMRAMSQPATGMAGFDTEPPRSVAFETRGTWTWLRRPHGTHLAQARRGAWGGGRVLPVLLLVQNTLLRRRHPSKESSH